jgi:hypothetical protein
MRLCERCSHLYREHTGDGGECDCCDCPRFRDEPDYIAPVPGQLDLLADQQPTP